MDRAPLPLRFLFEDDATPGETLVLDAGPYIAVFSTTLDELGPLRLHATYLNHPTTDEVVVSELADSGEDPELSQRTTLEMPGALTYGRSALLIDHLARVQALAQEAGLELRIDDASIERAARQFDPLARA